VPTDTLLKPLKLSSHEVSYVVAFLQSLTALDGGKPRARRAPDPCR
jgi:hypothetical protein